MINVYALGIIATLSSLAVTSSIAQNAPGGINQTGPNATGTVINNNNTNSAKSYRFCFGEYERACQTHDIYGYCGQTPDSWAAAHCDPPPSIVPIATYGGNKCGYAIIDVICQNPH
jgi:hypothetical protein